MLSILSERYLGVPVQISNLSIFSDIGSQQWGPGYGPQVAAMQTLPLAAQLSSTASGPIQTPDVQLENIIHACNE